MLIAGAVEEDSVRGLLDRAVDSDHDVDDARALVVEGIERVFSFFKKKERGKNK